MPAAVTAQECPAAAMAERPLVSFCWWCFSVRDSESSGQYQMERKRKNKEITLNHIDFKGIMCLYTFEDLGP